VTAPERVTLARPEPAIAEDADSAHPELSGPWHAVRRGRPGGGRGRLRETRQARGLRHAREARPSTSGARWPWPGTSVATGAGKSLEAERRGVGRAARLLRPGRGRLRAGRRVPARPVGDRTGTCKRGSNVYDFIVPGDPLTPGWASVAGAQRIREDDFEDPPEDPDAPLSFRDAREILERLGGRCVPAREWQVAAPSRITPGRGGAGTRRDRRAPGGPAHPQRDRAHPGADPDPDVARQVVLLSNHHDAWTFGGVDHRRDGDGDRAGRGALGELQRSGARPRRTIVIGSGMPRNSR